MALSKLGTSLGINHLLDTPKVATNISAIKVGKVQIYFEMCKNGFWYVQKGDIFPGGESWNIAFDWLALTPLYLVCVCLGSVYLINKIKLLLFNIILLWIIQKYPSLTLNVKLIRAHSQCIVQSGVSFFRFLAIFTRRLSDTATM